MALAIDGTATGNSSTLTVACTLTTAQPNDLIYVVAGTGTGNATDLDATTIADTAGLSWTQRVNYGEGNSAGVIVFYAIASSPLSSDVITVTLDKSAEEPCSIVAFGISGANTSSPFDPNFPLGGGSAAATTITTAAFSTTYANEMILLGVGIAAAQTSFTAGDIGGTLSSIVANELSNTATGMEYLVVSSVQSSITATLSWNNSAKFASVHDAIVAAGAAPSNHFLALLGAGT